MSGKFYLGLLPWMVFEVVARSAGQGMAWAGSAAGVTAAAILLLSVRSGSSVKALNVGAIILFAAITVAGMAAPAHAGWLQRYDRSIAAAGLGVIAFASLAVDPFVAQYMREAVTAQQWRTADFQRGTRAISVVWGVTAVAVAASHALASAVATRGVATVFNWLVPMALVVAAVQQTLARSSQYFDEPSMSMQDGAALLETLTDVSRRR